MNVAGGFLEGAQLSVGMNYANDQVRGGQGGAINFAKGSVEGVQAGIVNIAQSASFQIGLINIVDETKGLSLGLINYAVKDGIFDLRIFSSDVALVGFGVDLGTKHYYTGLSFMTWLYERSDAFGVGAHIGGRFYPGKKLELSLELSSQMIFMSQIDDTSNLSSLRLTLGYRVNKGFSVFAGPALRLSVEAVGRRPLNVRILAPGYSAQPGEDRVYIWPGIVAGIQAF